MKYKCIKKFAVCRYDEDGNEIDGFMEIEEGSIWEEEKINIIGGEVHLVNTEKLQWLEISKYTL